MELLRGAAVDLTARLSEASALSPYGVDARYPGDLPEPTQVEVRQAVAVAERVRDAVFAHLPAEFRAAGTEG